MHDHRRRTGLPVSLAGRRPIAFSWGLAAAMLVGLGGCARSNPWREGWAAAPVAAEPRPAVSEVQVRSIPWARMSQTLASAEQAATESDVHPDDWSPARRQAADAELLRGLQVSGDAEAIRILGQSEFRTVRDLRPDGRDEAELAAFAREIGATDVVWSSVLLGKADTIVQRPVSTVRYGSIWDRYYGDSRSGFDRATSWVPVRIETDQRGFVAFFLAR
ncbi:MAG: hypothetical protein AB8G96_15645 [Phycisphaerales bacterium]